MHRVVNLAPRDLRVELGLADIAAGGLGCGNHLQERPEELDVEVPLGPVHGAVVQLLRGEGLQILTHADYSRRCRGSGSSSSSTTASVTSVGVRPRSTVSLVTTHFLTSRREGSSNWTSSRISSMIERRPRAPVSRARPFSATAVRESSENTSSMPSKEKKR